MLEVQVKFENNLYTEMMLETKRVPCLCRISDKFYIDFLESIPSVTGQVINWKLEDIDKRVPAAAGGKYLHHKYGLITLVHIRENIYVIETLEMFARGIGWVQIIDHREYAAIPKVEEPDWLKDL